jgi:hypothetical protein
MTNQKKEITNMEYFKQHESHLPNCPASTLGEHTNTLGTTLFLIHWENHYISCLGTSSQPFMTCARLPEITAGLGWSPMPLSQGTVACPMSEAILLPTEIFNETWLQG